MFEAGDVCVYRSANCELTWEIIGPQLLGWSIIAQDFRRPPVPLSSRHKLYLISKEIHDCVQALGGKSPKFDVESPLRELLDRRRPIAELQGQILRKLTGMIAGE